MNTGRGNKRFNNFQILLVNGSSSTISTNNLTSKLKCRKPITNTCRNQAGDFMTTKMANVDVCLLEFIVTKIVTCKLLNT